MGDITKGITHKESQNKKCNTHVRTFFIIIILQHHRQIDSNLIVEVMLIIIKRNYEHGVSY
jgi:hypothetical protein